MAGLTEIANLALSDLGADLITDIAENSEHARTIAARYASVRDAVLRAHPWNCALARASLPALATPPAWGYANAFQLPSDPYCLRVWMADTDDAWKVEGRRIVTDAAAPLAILYAKRVTDADEFDALLVETLAARLAAACAVRIVQSNGVAEAMWRLYQAKLSEAREIDAQEGTPETFGSDDFLASRA